VSHTAGRPARHVSTGSELEQISAFLDNLEAGAEHVIAEARALRRRMLTLQDASDERLYDLRVSLEHLLIQLGGPSGQVLDGVINPDGSPVSFHAATDMPFNRVSHAEPPRTAPVDTSMPPTSLASPPQGAPFTHAPMPPPSGSRVA
jgi:hypothetical protein